MAKYTIRGSNELDRIIDGHLRSIASEAQPGARAGVLIGGYGRGEGTPFINSDGSQSPFNDYDLVVIVENLNPAIRQKFRRLEKELSAKLGLPVDLCPYLLPHLHKCEFSLLNYEMKQGHKVIWGDQNILAAMPDYPRDAIPLSEGTRLLLNRGKLLLDMKRRLANPEPPTAEERIRFIKFIQKVHLALGDCALLAEGKYDMAYAVKKERIATIGNIPGRDEVIVGYLKAIELKEWGDYRRLEKTNLGKEYKRTLALFLRFMPWYRGRHSRRECSIPKAVALNLKWTGRLSPNHPRVYLCQVLLRLLQDKPTIPAERFYELQRRFS